MIKGDRYEVVNVEKVGRCVLHTLDKEVSDDVKGE